MAESRWLVRSSDAGNAAPLRLVCFPFAGGGASLFRNWGRVLGQSADVYAVQLPGREERIAEPRYFSISKVARAFLDAEESLFDENTVLFGHSMGAKLAYEVARVLSAKGKAPRLLMVSASRPPCVPPVRTLYDLPEAEFTEAWRNMAGTPEAILNDEGFMRMYRPILRADLTMDETYNNDTVLDIPCVAFCGTQDAEVQPAVVAQWRCMTKKEFSVHTIVGEHFFIKKQEKELLDLVKDELCRVL